MRPDAAPSHRTVRLADYRPPLWLVDDVRLEVDLQEDATRVTAKLKLRRNPERLNEGRVALRLDGRKLKLVSVSIDGRALKDDQYALDGEGVSVGPEHLPGKSLEWECVTEINPAANTALEGLYMSRDMFCTQCEAEGFRKITFYPDRPDVMSLFSVRIEADKERYPVLLSNGNPIDQGDLPTLSGERARHYAEWRDPFPKPSYLFALVAGDLTATRDVFETADGRSIDLALYTRRSPDGPGDETKSAYALDALKRSMRWDEEKYGRIYDLDLFMIVAVDDFNMGAMENKGLNVFNSKYVLASPETATDRDYELIESVVAHEYFHNWTGNRITCRDWFQLCLKEGLTVFRDQQFSEDCRSAAVMRIDTIKTLRARQFREDAGPLAHPVRPSEYIEINNFYTATVYEKGAEVVRMLHTLLGADIYRKALDLYFERHDGQACTIEQFLSCFEDAAQRDLSHFALWWSQAGTPRLKISEVYDPKAQVYSLTIRQTSPATPNQAEKRPLLIPFAFGMLAQNGAEIRLPGPGDSPDDAPTTRVLELTDAIHTFHFESVPERPVLSPNRGFSAPVILERATTAEERAFLLAHDPDPVSRWEAGRALTLEAILDAADVVRSGGVPGGAGEPGAEGPLQGLMAALGATLTNGDLDPAFRALVLTFPSEDELAGAMAERSRPGGVGSADPDAILAARTHVRREAARALAKPLATVYAEMTVAGPYRPTAEDAGKRALKNVCLQLLAALGSADAFALTAKQFDAADNMTDQMPALVALTHEGAPQSAAALAQFYERWKHDSLVLGKWFALQATSPQEDAIDRIVALTDHPAFEWRNPNKFRALIGSFAMGNPTAFHRRDGAGYRLFTDWLLKLDPVNPQTTAKLIGAFETWRRYDAERQGAMKAELERIAGTAGLSKDAGEMVGRILKA